MTSTGTAIKQVSENPAGNAVTSPSKGVPAEDIESKMRLYGVLQAFREGKYPSNEQIDRTLGHWLETSPIELSKLSKEGRMLIQDFRNVIYTAKQIVDKKNADELFQNFLYHTRQVDPARANLNNVDTPNKEDMKSDGDEAVRHLRTLGKLIFTNSEARKLFKDIGILGRDVAADAAAKVSDVARPADHELEKVDEPAPSNQWVGPDGQTRSHNEAVPDTGLAAKREEAQAQKEELKQQANEEGKATGNRVANAADSAQQGQPTDEDRAGAAKDAAADQASQEKESKKKQLINKIPDEHKEKAKEQIQKAKDYARDKFPEERRDRYIYRLKKVVVENQRHRDYQEAIDFFLDRAEHYHGHAKNITSQAGDEGLNVREHGPFQQAENELRTLLERFANGKSSQPIFDAVDQLYTDAKNDEHLRQWFHDLDSYVRRCLQEPGFIMKDQADREGRELRDRGKSFWDPKEGKYAGHKDNLFDSFTDFFKAYADDPLNVQLGEDVKKLTKDLLMDGDGNLKYKPHLWSDVREVILPSLAKQIGVIPIPRIEYTDATVDVVLENLVLQGQNILPNVLELEARNYFKISPYSAIKDQSKHSFWVSFSQVQADIKDLAFYIKKKQGFPKIKDSGFIDVFLGGKGISGKIHLESTGRKDHAFNIVAVKVKVDRLKFAIRDSKYSFLIATLRPLLTSIIKKGVQKGIENGIRNGLVQLDAQLADISERIEAAKQEDDSLGTFDAIKQSYQAKKDEAAEAKEQAKEKAPSGQFQITAKRDSKLVDWSSPNSVVEKEGHYSDKAAKGQGWKSPAFDIVPVTGSSVKKTPATAGYSSTAGSKYNNSVPNGGVASTQTTNALNHTSPAQTQATTAH